MKSVAGTILMGLSPFFAAAAFLAILKGIERYNKWKYERAIAERNAKLKRYGLTPFPGTKALGKKALEEWLQ
jgi:hypothetical protein